MKCILHWLVVPRIHLFQAFRDAMFEYTANAATLMMGPRHAFYHSVDISAPIGLTLLPTDANTLLDITASPRLSSCVSTSIHRALQTRLFYLTTAFSRRLSLQALYDAPRPQRL